MASDNVVRRCAPASRGLALTPVSPGIIASPLAEAGRRGTPLVFPAPTLKIASDAALAERKPRWIDFDAGAALAQNGLQATSDALMALVLETASGQTTCAERNGERGIALWKRGVTL